MSLSSSELELSNESLLGLKKIIDAPSTFLKYYFDQLRYQVNEAFDQLKDEDDTFIQAEKNKNRTDMIEKINTFENECITNAEVCFKKNQPLINRQMNLIQNELTNFNPDRKDLIYMIQTEASNLKRILFMNKTLAFIERFKCDEKCILSYLIVDKPKTSAGKLLFIKNCYITTENIDQLHKQQIDFSNNGITNELIKLNELCKSELNSKQIDELNIPSDLKEIKLRNKQANSLDPNAFADLLGLTFIDLSGNRIETLEPLTFSRLHSLRHLNLSHNLLGSIPTGAFKELISLRELDLSNNQILLLDSSTFLNLSNLRKLYLSFNQLANIDSSTFNCYLNNLRELYLNDNKLTTLHPRLLANLTNLFILWLQNNQFEAVDLSMFKELNLKILRLSSESEIVFETKPKTVSKKENICKSCLIN